MVTKFFKIAVTLPDFIKDEAQMINKLFDSNEVNMVHIRKPGASASAIEKLLSQIHHENLGKIKLHDHFELIEKYPIGGIHLNGRNRIPYQGAKNISTSLHTIEEVNSLDWEKYDYFFLSPIFDSISKKGYKGKFNFKDLSTVLEGKNAVALGGVTPEKFPLLKSLNFKGAAMSGYFFLNHLN